MSLILREPLLAAKTPKPEQMHILDKHWPMLYSHKLDGIRFFVEDGVVLSRSRLPIRSAYVQEMYGRKEFEDIDGELIYGLPYGPGVYDRTYSAVMTMGCALPVHCYVFDRMIPGTYIERHNNLLEWYNKLPAIYDDSVKLVDQEVVRNWSQTLDKEKHSLAQGYEGGMLRHPRKEYKYGRASLVSGELIKLKRYKTGEAIITGFEELVHNNNEAVIGRLGRIKITVHQENQLPGNTLGSLLCKDLISGVPFKVGGGEGMDQNLRKWIWENREICLGRWFRYKHLGYGEKYSPRQPQWNGWRDLSDVTHLIPPEIY